LYRYGSIWHPGRKTTPTKADAAAEKNRAPRSRSAGAVPPRASATANLFQPQPNPIIERDIHGNAAPPTPPRHGRGLRRCVRAYPYYTPAGRHVVERYAVLETTTDVASVSALCCVPYVLSSFCHCSCFHQRVRSLDRSACRPPGPTGGSGPQHYYRPGLPAPSYAQINGIANKYRIIACHWTDRITSSSLSLITCHHF
jgi:hypothetical protein